MSTFPIVLNKRAPRLRGFFICELNVLLYISYLWNVMNKPHYTIICFGIVKDFSIVEVH